MMMQATLPAFSQASCAWALLSRTASSRVAATSFVTSRQISISSPCVSVKRASKRNLFSVVAADAATATPANIAPAITLTDKALAHLSRLRASQAKDLCLRVGVRQGGCSGMSYVMDFEERSNLRPDDSIIEYEGFNMVCDPKSLLFLFGMQLDYSDALIGGGFSFSNPNASSTCGCGKSFAA